MTASADLSRPALSSRLSPGALAPLPGKHLGLRWGNLEADDVTGLASRWEGAPDADGPPRAGSARYLLQHWRRRAGSEAPCVLTVGRDRSGEIQAFAVVDVNDWTPGSELVAGEYPDALQVDLRGWVAPAWRGVGIGRGLLAWQDGRARALAWHTLMMSDIDLPVRIGDYVPESAGARRRLLVAGGYTPLRRFQVMGRTLPSPAGAASSSAAPAALSSGAVQLPPGYRWGEWAREEGPGKLCPQPIDPRIVATHNAAFTRHWGSGGQTRAHFDTLCQPLAPEISPVILDRQERVAAYLLATWKGSAGSHRTGYILFLGVRPDQRGRGLAKALLRQCGWLIALSGGTAVGLDVDVDGDGTARELYARAGFTMTGWEDFYGIEL